MLAPLGLIVKDLPAQIEPLLTEMVGFAFTVTVIGVRVVLDAQVKASE